MGEYRTKLKSTWVHDMLVQQREGVVGSAGCRSYANMSRLACLCGRGGGRTTALEMRGKTVLPVPTCLFISRIGPAIKLPCSQSWCIYRPALQGITHQAGQPGRGGSAISSNARNSSAFSHSGVTWHKRSSPKDDVLVIQKAVGWRFIGYTGRPHVLQQAIAGSPA
jgi:hypothetical protein